MSACPKPKQATATPSLWRRGELNVLRCAQPRATRIDLFTWTDAIVATCQIESRQPDQRRLRHAACLISDLGWRAHPDYRGAAAVGTVANAAFIGIDHVDRCFLAATINNRYEGLDGSLSADWRTLLTPGLHARAKLIGGAMRVAFQLSSATGGVLPRAPLRGAPGKLVLSLPPDLADLASARLQNRLRQLARLIDRDSEVTVG